MTTAFFFRICADSQKELVTSYESYKRSITATGSSILLGHKPDLQTKTYSYAKAAASIELLAKQIVKEQPQEPIKKASNNKIAMLFTGQGSQLAFMGQELYQTQTLFRKTFDQCCNLLTNYLDGVNIKDIIFNNDPKQLNNTLYTQPALFVLEYCIATLWHHWGVNTNFVMGHSVGEYPAACFATYLSMADGLALIAKRAQLMQRLPTGGAMAAVMASAVEVKKIITEDIEIAAINAPKQTVIAGDKIIIEKYINIFKENKIKCRELVVSHAFHSYLMEPMLSEFTEFAKYINYQESHIALVSNLTGNIIKYSELSSHYWKDHVREKVNFLDGLATIDNAGTNIYLEVGPQPFLIGLAQKSLRSSAEDRHYLASLKKNTSNLLTMLETAVELDKLGVNIKWHQIESI